MKNKKPINEELTRDELKEIRELIRLELAEVFFDLYRKKSVWKN